MKNIKKFICILFVLTFGFIFYIHTTFAVTYKSSTDTGANPLDLLANTAITSGYSDVSTMAYAGLPALAGSITYTILMTIGVIFTCLIVYAGYLWLTSRGNSEQTKKAKEILTTAIIGVFIIFGAYIITNLIYSALQLSTPK